MSFVRESLNYIWCTTNLLGKGATGAVFQGVNKNNGESVAVKTFNQMSHMRPMDVQMREFEVLKRVNHENIVKLLAIEDDQEGREKVIVMELCTGGSLLNILDDNPENTYGLPEKEFLLVLEHLCAGMKYLRDNRLVHRDLKPGNIMKFISKDGQTIYKLIDFGAARELEENQSFMSLCGTEEYLHPDMYERAILRKSVTRSFTANVDLWSIGVTLYHVATGNLPFRPYGGRRNRQTMHFITTKKTSGVISGTQLTENGPIEWSKTLPEHCQLSNGLKRLVTPLLAGLLEDNREKMWTFNRFFQEVTHILQKRILHVFDINKTSSIEVFLDKSNLLDTLKEHIYDQTWVKPENQILLFGNEHLETKVGTRTNVKGYPKTDSEHPIFLFSRENNNVQLPRELDLPKFPTFPNGVSVENDASLAKVACSVGHECKRRIESYTLMDILIKAGVEQFAETVRTTLTNLSKKIQHFDDLLSTVIELSEAVVLLAIENKSDDEVKDEIEDLNTIKGCFDSTAEQIQQLYNRFITENSLSQKWRSLMRDKQCPHESRPNAQAKYFVERLRDSWQHLLRDRATGSLTDNDERFHALEKIKITENGKCLKSLLLDDVQPNVAQIAESLAEWYKLAQTAYLPTQILEKDIREYKRNIRDCRERLYQIRDKLRNDKNVNNKMDNINQLTNIELKNKLRTLQTHQRDINLILRQNEELIQMLKSFGLGKDKIASLNQF